MKKVCLMTLIFLCAALTTGAYGFDNETTTLKNGDSETYEYTVKTTPGGVVADDGPLDDNRVEYGTGVSNGRIHADSRAYICKFGCELTLNKTGQTITVNPGDSVVIDKGVMQVK